MDIHKNACLTPRSRAELVRRVVEQGQTPKAVATAFGVCVKTVRKWLARWRAEGEAGLADRSSRPRRLRRPTPAAVAARVGELRRQRWTGKAIAAELGVSPATVSRVLGRLGLSRLRDPRAGRAGERERPGELIHLDIKKLGRFEAVGHRITGRSGHATSRGAGWEFVHVCVDDASRIAFSRILPDARKQSATAFLGAAVAYYRSLGVEVARVMTDTTAPATGRSTSATPAATSGSGTSAPGPIPRRPTARPSASSRPRCASGPMPEPTRARSFAPPSCRSGSTDTTGIARTAA